MSYKDVSPKYLFFTYRHQFHYFLPYTQVPLFGKYLRVVTCLVDQYKGYGQQHTCCHPHAHGAEEKIEAYRHAVNTIDEEVESLVKLISACGSRERRNLRIALTSLPLRRK